MITVQELSRHYGPFHALKGISFQIEKGEIVGFLGPNGAGKTTTMRIITGALAPSAGQVFFQGACLQENRASFDKQLGYLPESAPAYPEMRVIDYLNFVARIRELTPRSATASVMDLCGLTAMATKRIGQLSKGYRQRVGLAQALIHDPDILILDEPSSGLDPNQIQEMMTLIKSFAGQKTVLFSSHILAEVEAVSTRVVILNEGQVVADQDLESLKTTMGGQRIQLKVAGPPVEDLIVRLDALQSVKIVQSQPNEEDGNATIMLHMDSSQTNRSDLARIVIDGGWQLVELSEQDSNLGELFEQLTRASS